MSWKPALNNKSYEEGRLEWPRIGNVEARASGTIKRMSTGELSRKPILLVRSKKDAAVNSEDCWDCEPVSAVTQSLAEVVWRSTLRKMLSLKLFLLLGTIIVVQSADPIRVRKFSSGSYYHVLCRSTLFQYFKSWFTRRIMAMLSVPFPLFKATWNEPKFQD